MRPALGLSNGLSRKRLFGKELLAIAQIDLSGDECGCLTTEEVIDGALGVGVEADGLKVHISVLILIPVEFLELGDDLLGTNREIAVEESGPFVLVVGVYAISVSGGLILVYIATVIAPTGRLGIDRFVYLVIKAVKDLDGTFGRKSASLIEEKMSPVVEASLELLVIHQPV